MKTKLYNAPRNSYVRVLPQETEDVVHTKENSVIHDKKSENVKVPIGANPVSNGDLIYFSHVDGMYSLCQSVDESTMKHGETTHMAAWTEVEVVDLSELFTFEQIREQIGRSGYGKDGQGEFREANLKDMSDSWVEASIKFVDENHPHRKFYEQELEYRKQNDIVIEDV